MAFHGELGRPLFGCRFAPQFSERSLLLRRQFVLDSYEQRHLFPFDFAFRGQQDPVCFVVAFSSNGACRAFIYPDTATTCLVRISCLWTTDFVFVDY